MEPEIEAEETRTRIRRDLTATDMDGWSRMVADAEADGDGKKKNRIEGFEQTTT